MREILFRGYSKEDNQWYYGYLNRFYSSKSYKINDEKYCGYSIVEEDSIGQYTGFEDKNGKKIFEGDVLNCDIISNGTLQYIVKFKKGCWIAEIGNNLDESFLFTMSNVKVVSNTYEEKLKEENKNERL